METVVDKSASLEIAKIKWTVVLVYLGLQLVLPLVVGVERVRFLASSGLLLLVVVALVLRWTRPDSPTTKGIGKGVLACIAITLGLALVGVLAVTSGSV